MSTNKRLNRTTHVNFHQEKGLCLIFVVLKSFLVSPIVHGILLIFVFRFFIHSNLTVDASGKLIKTEAVTPHNFEQHRLLAPSWCDCCEKFIFARKAMRCTACNVVVHRSCRRDFVKVNTCLQKRNDEIEMPFSKVCSKMTEFCTAHNTMQKAKVTKTTKSDDAVAAYWIEQSQFDRDVDAVPLAVESLITFLRAHDCVHSQGIFRLSGNSKQVIDIHKRYVHGETVDLEKELKVRIFSFSLHLPTLTHYI